MTTMWLLMMLTLMLWQWQYKLLIDDSDSSDHGFMNFYGILLVSKFSSFLCWSNMQTSILIFSLQIDPSSIMESIGNWSSREHQDGNFSTLQPQFFSPLEACLRYLNFFASQWHGGFLIRNPDVALPPSYSFTWSKVSQLFLGSVVSALINA